MAYGSRGYGEAAYGDGASAFPNHAMGGTSSGSATTAAVASVDRGLSGSPKGVSEVPYANMGPHPAGSVEASRIGVEVLGRGFGAVEVSQFAVETLGRGFGAVEVTQVGIEVLQRVPISIGSGAAAGSAEVQGNLRRELTGVYYADAVQDKEPTWFFRFEEDPASTVFTDHRGQFTFSNASTPANTPTSGVPSAAITQAGNKGLTFDGVNDTVRLSPATSLTQTFTFQVWAKPTATITVHTQASTGTAGLNGQRFLFYPHHGGAAAAGAGLSVGTNGVSVYEHGDALLPPVVSWAGTVTDWSLLTVVYENRIAKLYVNQTLVATGAVSSRATVLSPTVLGSEAYGWYQGDADEAALFARPLTQPQIEEIYRAGRSDIGASAGEATVAASMEGGTEADLGTGNSLLGEFTMGLSLLGGETGGGGQQLALAPFAGAANGSSSTVVADPTLAYKLAGTAAGSASLVAQVRLDIPTLSGASAAGATFPGDYFLGPRLRKQAYELPIYDTWSADGDFVGTDGAEWHNDKWLAVQQGPTTSTKILDVQGGRGRLRVQQPIQGAGTSVTAVLRSAPLGDFDQSFDSQMIAHAITGQAYFCFRSTGVLISGTNGLVGSVRDGYSLHLGPGGPTATTFLLYRNVAGVQTLLGTGTRGSGLTAASNESWRIRVVGNRIQVKSWAQGTAEPSTYQIDVTDNTYATGTSLVAVGQAYTGSNAPAVIEQRFDNFVTADVSTPLTGSPAGSATVTGQFGYAVVLAGSASAGATVTSDLSISNLRGAPAAGADVTGALNLNLRLLATSVSAATLNATLSNVRDLGTAILNGQASVSADLTFPRELSATVQAAGTCTVTDLDIHILRGGRADGLSAVVGNLRLAYDYAIDSLASATVTGTVGLDFNFATATIAASATVTGNQTFPRDFGTGNSTGTSTVTADVLTYILSGSLATGSSTVAAHLSYLNDIVALRGAPAGVTTIEADTRMRFKFIPQASNGSAAVVCHQLLRVWFVEGQPAGSATVTFDTLTIHYPAPGPIVGAATVVAHLSHDARYGGTILGESANTSKLSASYLMPTATSQGTAAPRGILYVRPQDFEVDTSQGSAEVLAKMILTQAQLTGISRGGRFDIFQYHASDGTLKTDDRGVPIVTTWNDKLVTAHMSLAFFFQGISRAEGTCEIEAILLINDSGLIRGNSRLDVHLDRLSTEYQAKPAGFASVLYAFLDRPQDMRANVNDAYAGVGKWYPGSRYYVRFYGDRFPGQFRPLDDTTADPAHGEPGHVHVPTGANFGPIGEIEHDNTERRFVANWDGTYTDFTQSDTPNLPKDPWWKDPDQSGITPPNIRYINGLPGPLRRRYQLADPGQLGGWYVDNSGPGFRDLGMFATIVGEARFDEPQSTVDMDLELKSSMKGQIFGSSVVAAFALLLSYRKLLATGNVTALRYLLREATGNTAKSDQARVPITQAESELIRPTRKTTALYV